MDGANSGVGIGVLQPGFVFRHNALECEVRDDRTWISSVPSDVAVIAARDTRMRNTCKHWRSTGYSTNEQIQQPASHPVRLRSRSCGRDSQAGAEAHTCIEAIHWAHDQVHMLTRLYHIIILIFSINRKQTQCARCRQKAEAPTPKA